MSSKAACGEGGVGTHSEMATALEARTCRDTKLQQRRLAYCSTWCSMALPAPRPLKLGQTAMLTMYSAVVPGTTPSPSLYATYLVQGGHTKHKEER